MRWWHVLFFILDYGVAFIFGGTGFSLGLNDYHPATPNFETLFCVVYGSIVIAQCVATGCLMLIAGLRDGQPLTYSVKSHPWTVNFQRRIVNLVAAIYITIIEGNHFVGSGTNSQPIHVFALVWMFFLIGFEGLMAVWNITLFIIGQCGGAESCPSLLGDNQSAYAPAAAISEPALDMHKNFFKPQAKATSNV